MIFLIFDFGDLLKIMLRFKYVQAEKNTIPKYKK